MLAVAKAVYVMSDWDQTRRKREDSSWNYSHPPSNYTLFAGPGARFAHLILDEERDCWSVSDIRDLSVFIEDLVLAEHVGVGKQLYEHIGPGFS
jgi:hypothetical protein